MEVSMLIAVASVILFCVCCYFFLKALFMPVPLFNTTTYSKAALRLKKSYQALSWGLMTFVFLSSLVISFVEVLTQI